MPNHALSSPRRPEYPDWPARPHALAPEVHKAQQAGDDAGESVKVAALRDGVQMRADAYRGAGRFVGKTDDEVLRRVAHGRQSFPLREPFEEGERAAFGLTVAFARDTFAIPRARRDISKKLRGQRAKRSAVQFSPGPLSSRTARTTYLSRGSEGRRPQIDPGAALSRAGKPR